MRPVIVVARNCLALTKNTVRSIQAQDMEVTVLVVDNFSSDGTSQWLSSKSIASLHFLRQASVSECWNTGLRNAWLAGADRALVVNNDVELRSDTYRILETCDQPFITGVGVNSRGQVGIAGDRVPDDLLAEARPHPDFSCFMIKREVTGQVGWFDESYYPAYCEDSQMHVRMHRAGIKALCIDLPFYHDGSQTLKNASPGEVARIQRGSENNRKKFMATYGCVPGTPEYAELFSDETFGCDLHHAQ